MKQNDQIIDTFPSFLRAVETQQPGTIDDWLRLWSEDYMTLWPELFEMQVADYAEQGEDWRKVAREMVFPGMRDKVPVMKHAYRELGSIIKVVAAQTRQRLAFVGDVCYVLYVGIGNGAGWVTTYGGRPAVLFGLEAIVDSGFDSPARLEGLVAHELGHVVHFFWREQGGREVGSGPWWQLYEEGFAQYCEGRILGHESWHMRTARQDQGWLTWCQDNRAWLAGEFQRMVDDGESTRPFFGSWYDIKGHKQTGYYLGHEVINHLTGAMSLSDIALLERGPALEQRMRRVLDHFAAGAP